MCRHINLKLRLILYECFYTTYLSTRLIYFVYFLSKVKNIKFTWFLKKALSGTENMSRQEEKDATRFLIQIRNYNSSNGFSTLYKLFSLELTDAISQIQADILFFLFFFSFNVGMFNYQSHYFWVLE